MAKLDAFFKLMVDQGASDLHLVSGSQPILRVSGELQRVRYTVLGIISGHRVFAEFWLTIPHV